MSLKKSLTTFAAASLVLGIGATPVSAHDAAEHTASDLFGEMMATYQNASSYSTAATVTQSMPGAPAMTTTINLSMVKPDKYRSEVIQSVPEQMGGGEMREVLLFDTDSARVYVGADQNAVIPLPLKTFDAALAQDQGGSRVMVPVIMAAESPEAFLAEIDMDEFVFVEHGEIDGVATHVVAATGQVDGPAGAMDVSISFHISDSEPPMLLRVMPDYGPMMQGMTMSIDLADQTFGTELAEAVFTLGAPDDAKVYASIQEFITEMQGGPSAAEGMKGEAAPAFELADMSGGNVALASHKGKDVVILDFWATWCGPCREAMPKLEKLADEFEDKNVVLYAVNLRETPEQAKKFLDDQGIDVSVLFDTDGAIGEKYNVEGIPQTVIIDKEGNIAAVHVGMIPGLEDSIREQLTALTSGEKVAIAQ